MENKQTIIEKLSNFNNITLTKVQWDIVLKGCGCPKSYFFWNALRKNNLNKQENKYTLTDINTETFSDIWEDYCINNRDNAKQHYLKNKARKKAREKVEHFTGVTLYMIGGVLSTEKPERE